MNTRMSSTNLKYIGSNLILVVLAFWVGSHLIGRETQTNQTQPSAETFQLHTITARAKPKTPAHQKIPTTSFASSSDVLSANDLKSRLGELGPLNSERAYDQMMDLLLALAAKDPNAAIDYILHTLKPPFQNRALNGVLAVWAGNDGPSAWNWVKANRSGDSLLTGTVLNKIGSQSPAMAWQFATELATNQPDQAAGLYVSALSGMMYTGKYQDAARLLDDAVLPTNQTQASFSLTSLLASQWGAYAPADAAQWVLSLPAGDAKVQSLVALGQSWANVDPAQAVAFASQLPSSTGRTDMLRSGLNSWIANDPTAANSWISSVSAGPDYDQFASAIATTPVLMNNTPENSVTWAMSISDPNLKMESVVSVFTQWFHSADANAMAYLNQMPPNIQTEVRHRLGLVNPP